MSEAAVEEHDLEVHIKRMLIEGGRAEIQLDTDTEVILGVFDALLGFVAQAPNYQQAILYVKPAGQFQELTVAVTVVRPGGNLPVCIKCGDDAR